MEMGEKVFAREKEMRPVVSGWLESRGYNLLYERLVYCGYCDILAAKPRWEGIERRRNRQRGWRPLASHIVAVELKLHRVLEAFRQASIYRAGANAVYIAFPEEAVPKVLLHPKWPQYRDEGVGVLAVMPDGCEVVAEAESHTPLRTMEMERQAEKFWREIWKRATP